MKDFFRRLFFAGLFLCVFLSSYSQKQSVWIDADTGNEIDDVFALIRLLNEPSVSVAGISSAHFNNPDLLVFEKWNQYPMSGISSIDISQQLNEDIVSQMGRTDVVCPRGADRQIGRAWGGFEPRESEAVDRLVSCVKSLRPGEKLDVICLGAMTNLASAVILHPEIIPDIRCYLLGAQYNASSEVWDKNEFNVRNDLNAFDYLLKNESIDLTIMPITTALPYGFKKNETFARLPKDIPSHLLLKNRWEETEPGSMQRVMWDLALVEAYLNPADVKIEDRLVPPENGSRKVKVYISIEADKLIDDFWKFID